MARHLEHPRRHVAPPSTRCTRCAVLRGVARYVTQPYDVHLAGAGLRSTQFSILNRLKELGPSTIKARAHALVMDRPTLGRSRGPSRKLCIMIPSRPHVPDATFSVKSLTAPTLTNDVGTQCLSAGPSSLTGVANNAQLGPVRAFKRRRPSPPRQRQERRPAGVQPFRAAGAVLSGIVPRTVERGIQGPAYDELSSITPQTGAQNKTR
jgi:hypothetical protein